MDLGKEVIIRNLDDLQRMRDRNADLNTHTGLKARALRGRVFSPE